MGFSIAHAAERSRLSIDTVRYYERIGLMDPPARDSGGRRSYSDDDVAWLVFLTRLRMTGMPLRVIRDYVRYRRQGAEGIGPLKDILVEQRNAVLARIAALPSSLSGRGPRRRR
jgi:DNA-binding transcriptional MerR regulator